MLQYDLLTPLHQRLGHANEVDPSCSPLDSNLLSKCMDEQFETTLSELHFPFVGILSFLEAEVAMTCGEATVSL